MQLIYAQNRVISIKLQKCMFVWLCKHRLEEVLVLAMPVVAYVVRQFCMLFNETYAY